MRLTNVCSTVRVAWPNLDKARHVADYLNNSYNTLLTNTKNIFTGKVLYNPLERWQPYQDYIDPEKLEYQQPAFSPFKFLKARLVQAGVDPIDVDLLDKMYRDFKMKNYNSWVKKNYNKVGDKLDSFWNESFGKNVFTYPSKRRMSSRDLESQYFYMFKKDPFGYNPLEVLEKSLLDSGLSEQDLDYLSNLYFKMRQSKLNTYRNYILDKSYKERDQLLKDLFRVPAFSNQFSNSNSLSNYSRESQIPGLLNSKSSNPFVVKNFQYKGVDPKSGRDQFLVYCPQCQKSSMLYIKKDHGFYSKPSEIIKCPFCNKNVYLSGTAFNNLRNKQGSNLAPVNKKKPPRQGDFGIDISKGNTPPRTRIDPQSINVELVQ